MPECKPVAGCSTIRDPGNRAFCVLVRTYCQPGSLPVTVAQGLITSFLSRLGALKSRLEEAQTTPGAFAPALGALDLPATIEAVTAAYWAVDWHRRAILPAATGDTYPETVNAIDPKDGKVGLYGGRADLLYQLEYAKQAMAGTDGILRTVNQIGLDDFLVSVAGEAGRIAGEVAGGVARVAGQAVGAAAGGLFGALPWWVPVAGVGLGALLLWRAFK